MDILAGILVTLFVVLLLGAAVTFGFALLTACLAVAAVTMVLVLLREGWRRWWFLQSAKDRPPEIIEGEYKRIDKEHEEL